MKKILLSLFLVFAMPSWAENEWLHIYRTENGNTRVTTLPAEEIESITYSSTANNDWFDRLNLTAGENDIVLDLATIDRCEIGTNIPTIFIATENPNQTEILSKTDYVNATFEMKGYGSYEDIAPTPFRIRGRGNTTWGLPKKPYRLNFNNGKISICGFKKAKNYILLANFLDNTLMRNAIAFKIAQLLEMPYANHCAPVNVVFNGIFKGSYILTEKVGINAGSVDIDEATSILWELDTNFDEDFKFYSTRFELPVMVKDPDFDELAEDNPELSANNLFEQWKEDFQRMENAVFNNGTEDFTEYIDLNSLVDFMLVFDLCQNMELGHPKSCFLFKENIDEKYVFGPVWDFDWAFTYANGERPDLFSLPVLDKNSHGSKFFKAMVSDARFLNAFAERWNYFKTERLQELWFFFDGYANLIEPSAAQNGEIWPRGTLNQADSTEKFRQNVETLKTWLQNRIDFIDSDANFGLF